MAKVPANMFSSGKNEMAAEENIETEIGKIDLMD